MYRCAACSTTLATMEALEEGEVLCHGCAAAVAELAVRYPRLQPDQRLVLADLRRAMTTKQWRSLDRWLSRCQHYHPVLVSIALGCGDRGAHLH